MSPTEEERNFEAALAALKRTSPAVRERRRLKVAEKIADLERELQLLDSLPSSDNGAVPTTAETLFRADTATREGRLPNKPEGMLMVLAERPDRPRKLSDVRDVMVERGWLQPGEKGTHQIQNTAWKLKNRGDVKSPRTAYYRITQQGLEAVQR